jgi:hypothetical protein
MKGVHKKAEELPERQCLYCGKSFAPKQATQKYCQPSHKRANNNNMRSSSSLREVRAEVEQLREIVAAVDAKCDRILRAVRAKS